MVAKGNVKTHEQRLAIVEARTKTMLARKAVEEKEKAVLRAWQTGLSTRCIASFIGVEHGTVHRWIRRQEPF